MKRLGVAAIAAVLTTALAATAVIGQQGGDDDSGQQQQPAQVYGVNLQPVNDSGVEGTATLFVMPDGEFRAELTATNLTNWQVHPQHIHGNPGGGAASCPTEQQDENGDGIVSLEEGLPAYGPVALPLTQQQPFPVAGNEGSIVYNQTFNTSLTPPAGGTPSAVDTPADATPADGAQTDDETVTPQADESPTPEGTPEESPTPEATPTPVEIPLQDLTEGVIVVHGMTVNGEFQETVPVACGQIQVCPIDGTPSADGTQEGSPTPDETGTPEDGAADETRTPDAGGTPTTGEARVNIPPACPENLGQQTETPESGGGEGTPFSDETPTETPEND